MKKETKIIAFANHKGGVGKTTTTASVGSILANKGYKVLLIDLDAQANLTISFIKKDVEKSIYHAMIGKSPLPVIQLKENLSIVPASLQLAMADIELSSAISRESILLELLQPIVDSYDYILIDCPPSLGLMTLNAFTVSNEIIIPLTAEVLPLTGLKMIHQFISMVNKRLNNKAHISGILITRWENTNLGRKTEEGLRTNPQINTYRTKIRKNVTIAEAPLESKNIIEYAPKSNGAMDYIAFTEELLDFFNSKQ